MHIKNLHSKGDKVQIFLFIQFSFYEYKFLPACMCI